MLEMYIKVREINKDSNSKAFGKTLPVDVEKKIKADVDTLQKE